MRDPPDGFVAGVGPFCFGLVVPVVSCLSTAVDVVKVAVEYISVGVEVGDTVERATKVVARKL